MNTQPKGSMLQVIEDRAREEAEKTAFTVYGEPPCSYEMLQQKIDSTAHCLLQHNLVSGEAVLILIPNSRVFFFTFFGVLRAGGIAVPLFPRTGAQRVLQLAELCGARKILISGKHLPIQALAIQDGATARGMELVTLEALETDTGGSVVPKLPSILPSQQAMIQFTSGSTGDPRGVQLSHDNLITNIQQMIAGMAITSEDYFVSWLPVYHDMGLILMCMVPLYLGCPLILLPTGLSYLKTWLQVMSESRASFTAAPDFAYRLCLQICRESEAFDLTSLRVALNAAEPVRWSTIRDFEKRFCLHNRLLPAYGLAEAAVGVCSWIPGRKVKRDSRGHVCVGLPFPGVEMRIVGEGEFGIIQVRSPASTCGYLNNPQATADLFTPDGFMNTGDLGYQDEEGHFFITGRAKNTIIQGGRNLSAREVEEITDELPFVRRSAALGIDRGGLEGEQLFIFIEPRSNGLNHPREKLADMVVQVVQNCIRSLGLRPGRVILLKHGAIPRTPNGKTQYLHLKEACQSGMLTDSGQVLFQ